jgi:hypothetical protein
VTAADTIPPVNLGRGSVTTPAAPALSEWSRELARARRSCASRTFVYVTCGSCIALCIGVTWILLQAHAADEHAWREERVGGIEKQIDALEQSVRDGFDRLYQSLDRISGK